MLLSRVTAKCALFCSLLLVPLDKQSNFIAEVTLNSALTKFVSLFRNIDVANKTQNGEAKKNAIISVLSLAEKARCVFSMVSV